MRTLSLRALVAAALALAAAGPSRAGDAGGLPYGMKKGGTWASTSIAGVYMTIGGDATESDESSGFRCAR
jgi:hypothetical protein